MNTSKNVGALVASCVIDTATPAVRPNPLNVSGVVRTPAGGAAGDFTITIDGAAQIDATESNVKAQALGVGAASGMVCCHVNKLTDTTFQVTVLQEQAAGAGSILVDLDFDFAIWRRARTPAP